MGSGLCMVVSLLFLVFWYYLMRLPTTDEFKFSTDGSVFHCNFLIDLSVVEVQLYTLQYVLSLDETQLVVVRGLSLRSFNKVRQQGELNLASQLQPPGSTDFLNCYVKT